MDRRPTNGQETDGQKSSMDRRPSISFLRTGYLLQFFYGYIVLLRIENRPLVFLDSRLSMGSMDINLYRSRMYRRPPIGFLWIVHLLQVFQGLKTFYRSLVDKKTFYRSSRCCRPSIGLFGSSMNRRSLFSMNRRPSSMDRGLSFDKRSIGRQVFYRQKTFYRFPINIKPTNGLL